MWHRTVWYKFTPLSEDFVCFWRDSSKWAKASSITRFLDRTRWRTTFGRTPLGEWTARRRDFYLITHNTHNRQISMLSWRDSNPLSQQASGSRHTFYTVRHLGPAWKILMEVNVCVEGLHSLYLACDVLQGRCSGHVIETSVSIKCWECFD